MENKRVLIVDDSIVVRDMLKKFLEKQGYDVCGLAGDGREGVELYKAFEPDIVFMDISMPVMNGLEAIRAIKDLKLDAKIVVISAMGDDEIVLKAKELGVTEFLQKPFDAQSVISAISIEV